MNYRSKEVQRLESAKSWAEQQLIARERRLAIQQAEARRKLTAIRIEDKFGKKMPANLDDACILFKQVHMQSF